jgi:hypothetical protein
VAQFRPWPVCAPAWGLTGNPQQTQWQEGVKNPGLTEAPSTDLLILQVFSWARLSVPAILHSFQKSILSGPRFDV